MFGIFSRRSELLPIEGKRVYLRLPERSDFSAWRELRMESRSFLQPWEPSWAPDELSRISFLGRIGRYERDFAQGQAVPLFLLAREDDSLLGGVTIGYIRRGAAQSCMLGYWMGQRHAGRGYMSEAISLVVPHIFRSMKLHRIEAACIPENTRSIHLLEKAGFRREGCLREYLKINGVWRDHLMFARVAHRDVATAEIVSRPREAVVDIDG